MNTQQPQPIQVAGPRTLALHKLVESKKKSQQARGRRRSVSMPIVDYPSFTQGLDVTHEGQWPSG